MSSAPRFGISVIVGLLLVAPGPAQEAARLPADLPLVAPPAVLVAVPYSRWDVVAPRVGVGYTTGPGFGYEGGYAMFDGFIPLADGPPDRLTFLDLHALVSEGRDWGGNLALGQRYYNPNQDRIYGAWISYDGRDTHGFDFHQISGGLETIGPRLDLRGSLYIPTGQERQQFGDQLLCDPSFQGTHILLTHVRAFETALTTGDLEIGGPLPWVGRYGLRGYLGGYVFHGPGDLDGVGIRGRVDARLSNTLRVGVDLQNDRIFGTTCVVSASLHWGGIRRRYRSTGDTVYNRFADDIVRDHEIAVTAQTTRDREPALDPRTALPITVIHVNNTAPPGGNGSFEHPLNVLAPAPVLAGPDGIILVYRGDGTPRGLNQGVVLENGQRLLGDSLHYTFASQAGLCLLPNLLTGRPTLTNPNGDVVVLANDNEVAGLSILTTGGSGIRGIGITTFNLHDNLITRTGGPLFSGIDLTGVSGSGIIANNQISQENLAVSVATTDGADLNLAVSSNTTTANVAGIVLNSDAASRLDATVSSNRLLGNQVGLTASSAGASQMALTVSANTVVGSSQAGILEVSAAGSRLNAAVTGNTLVSNNVGLESVSLDISSLRTFVTNNTFACAGGALQLFALSRGTSRLGIGLSGNRVGGNAPVGVELNSQDSSTLVAAVDHNALTGTFLFGFAALSQDGSELCLGLHHNVSNGSLDAYLLNRIVPSTFLLEQDPGTNAGTPFFQSPGIQTVPAGTCIP